MSGGRYPWPYPPLEIPDTPGPLDGDLQFPEHGYPPRRGEGRPALSAWARLSRNGALGKKQNLIFRANLNSQSQVDILSIQGDDHDAQQMVVTLGPPLVIPAIFSQALITQAPQNATVEQDSGQIQDQGVFPGTFAPISWPQFVATLEWGVGGASYKAEVDFLNGATVNLVASFLRVHARALSSAQSDISGTSALYTLSAFVGPGWVPSRAQRTVYVGLLDALAESIVFEVPHFARTAYVIGCDPQAGPAVAVTVATLRFWQSPDGVAGANCVGNFVQTGAGPLGFPIPAAAAYASVLSGMGIASRFSIVFELSI